MTYAISLAIFTTILGPILASFFSVRIMRSEKLTAAHGQKSQCDSCGKTLMWYELIPIVSFVVQRGRCRACSAYIPIRMFLVELFGLFIYALVAGYIVRIAQLGAGLAEISVATVISVLLTSLLFYLAVFDVFTFTIPARFVVLSTLAVVACNALVLIIRLINPPALTHLPLGYVHNLIVGVVGGAAIWLLIILTKQRGMGVGDIYIALMLGLGLGWPRIVSAFYITIFVGTAVGLIYAYHKKRWRGLQVPLVPFLLLGYVGALFAGELIFHTLFAVV